VRARDLMQGIPNRGEIGDPQDRAMVVVEGATLATLARAHHHHHDHHQHSSIVGLGIFCWVLFRLAV
jgi:hypothetical protein